MEGKVCESSQASKEIPVDVAVNKKVIQVMKVRGADSPLYTAICPVVYVIRVFGLAPYEFDNDILVSSSFNSIYSYLCMGVYTYIIYTVLKRFTSIEQEQPLLGHTETGKVCSTCQQSFSQIVMPKWKKM